MKKMALGLMLVCFVARSATAQKLYIKAGAGYAAPMLGQKIDRYGNYYSGLTVVGGGTASYDLRNASFSSGIQGIMGGGCMFADNIGVELVANVNITSDQQIVYGTSSYNTVYVNAVTKKAGHTLILTPSLIMQTAYSKVNVYTRLGLALPLSARVTEVDSVKYGYTYSAYHEDHYSWKLKHYFSLGFTAAGGLKVNLKKQMAIWVEASMLYLSLSPKEKGLDYAVVNGKSLQPAEVSNTQTKYQYDKTGTTAQPPHPFSNLSANVGISYGLKTAKKMQKS